ncbi:MAG: TolC family protein [Bacteroidia bacterium]|nr:TolC family protein [Bacteroidia bacterium]
MKFFPLYCLLLPLSLWAQAPTSLTLDEALRYGLAHRPDLRSQATQTEVSRAAADQARNAWLPTVSASADFRVNTQLQTSVLPGEFQNQEDPILIRFGTRLNYLLGVSLDQPLYQASIRDNILLADNQVAQRENQEARLEETLKLDIAGAYYAVLLHAEKCSLSQAAVVRARADLADAEVKQAAGALLRQDYNRLLVALRNAEATLDTDTRDLATSRRQLNYQIGLPQDAEVIIADSLAALIQAADRPAPAFEAENRTELTAERLLLAQNQLNLNKALHSNRPEVSLYANYSLQHLNDQFNPFAADTWFPYNYLGLRVNVPIFDRYARRASVTEYRLQIQVNEENLTQLRRQLTNTWDQARTDRETARISLSRAQEDITLAREVLETDRLRFREGALTAATLAASQYALSQSESALLTALYNWLVADLNYQKATGTL